MYILFVPILIVALGLLAFLLAFLRRWGWAFLSLLAALTLNHCTQQVPLIPHSSSEPGNLRILSYNVCHKTSFAHLHDSAFVNYIVGLDADILFLPENHPGYEHLLNDTLNALYPYNMYPFNYGDQWVGELTLYSRYPLSNPRFYNLDIDAIVARHPEFDAEYLRLCGAHRLIYQIDADINGRLVTLVHVHLLSNHFDMAKADGEGRKQKAANVFDYLRYGYTLRQEEVRLMCDTLASWHQPLIIAGDFNDLSGSPVIRTLQRELNLRDAWWERGFGPGFTFADQGFRFRLDHILYSPEFQLERIRIDDVPYSDHLPLVADFTLQR